jgi:hypothetical protein
MFVKGTNRIEYPKYWTPVYTPLTKIDRDAYIVETDFGNICERDTSNINFLDNWFDSGLPYDPDTVILMLSKKRYEKAIGYGFKPLSQLMTDLMEEVTIPKTAVHAPLFDELYYNSISDLKILDLFGRAKPEQMEKLNKDSEVYKMLRIKEVIRKRYVNRSSNNAYAGILRYTDEENTPKVDEWVAKTIDNIKKMCENISKSFILLSDVRSYEMREEGKVEALIHYVNLITGEVK